MSEIPKDIKRAKYNKNDKFIWVDSQLENFMNRQKELEAEIVNLKGKLKNDNDYIKVLEMENAELKDQVLDLGGEYKERWGSEPLQGNKK